MPETLTAEVNAAIDAYDSAGPNDSAAIQAQLERFNRSHRPGDRLLFLDPTNDDPPEIVQLAGQARDYGDGPVVSAWLDRCRRPDNYSISCLWPIPTTEELRVLAAARSLERRGGQ